jgi:ASC-1-like (ASCH) protein
LPLLYAKKEVFIWLKAGQKTIDIRRGSPMRGEFAVFQSGLKILRLKVVKYESGRLEEVLRLDNFKLIVPSAAVLGDAVGYLRGIYNGYDGIFTAYYLSVENEDLRKC